MAMRFVVNKAGIRSFLKADGTRRVVGNTADRVAQEAAGNAGVKVTREPLPREPGKGPQYEGAMRRSDATGRNRVYSTITATHPNNRRRQQAREALQNATSALTDWKPVGRDV